MIEQEVTIYTCEHCRKYYKMKHAATRHEKYCSRNPENRHACFDCKFLDSTPEEIDDAFGYVLKIKSFRCKKHDVEMHTYVAARRRMEVANITTRMPVVCPDFEQDQ